MNTREFDYILKVSELKSITKAANVLHITQPALSRFIKDIEDELGARIFDRSTNPISLTYAGECYVESARRIMLEHERLQKEIRDITRHMTGRLRIGTSRDRASYMMPKLLPAFTAKYPGIKAEVFTESGRKLREALKEGSIDIMILPDTWPEDREDFGSRLIYSEELVLAAKAGTIPDCDLRNNRRSIIPEALNKMKFFLLFREHAMRSFCEKYFREHDIKPDIMMEFKSNITCYRMAVTGMGVTIVPRITTLMLESDDDAEIFSLDDEPVMWDVRAFHRRGAYIGEPEQELMRIAAEIFK